MKPLFSDGGLRILESLTFTKTLFAFDFDGTLSKIVSRPSDATMSSKTTELLQELSKRAPVAILSGRSLKDLKARLDFVPPFLIGNHGLEGFGLRKDSLEQSRKTCIAWEKFLESKFRKFQDPGLEIEDKDLSLAIHYRRCRSRKQMKKEIFDLLPELDPVPRILPGKCVVNLIPSGTPHKGIALLDLMERARVQSAFYIGDDDTDEDVFSVPDNRVFTVRVGRKHSSSAKYFIKGQSEVNQILKALIRFHRLSSASTGDRQGVDNISRSVRT